MSSDSMWPHRGAVPSALVLATLASFPGSGNAQSASDQARAIADLLSVIEAENDYALQNCQLFSSPVNLCRTSNCAGIGLTHYPAGGPEFIDGRLGRNGPYTEFNYLREWVPGAIPRVLGLACDPSSVVDYCYTATPAVPASGRASFAATGDGTIYIDRSGAEIPCPVPTGYEELEWPRIVEPEPGAVLDSSSVAFTVTENDVPDTIFRLQIGRTPGSSDLYDSTYTFSSPEMVHGLPMDGVTVYARLHYLVSDRWRSVDARYRAGGERSTDEPELLTPVPNGTLSGAETLFTWTPNETPVLLWHLAVGSEPSRADYFQSERPLVALSSMVDGLPTDGSIVFSRLHYREPGGGWSSVVYRHLAARDFDSSGPRLSFPAPGFNLPSDSTLARWTANGTAVTTWWIYAGSARGENDYFNSGPLRATSTTITGLPDAGNPVYLRLWYRVNLRWSYRDYPFGSVDLSSDATTGGSAASRRRPSLGPR